jgi:drug/metabolite transporter (DMT)-like permease
MLAVFGSAVLFYLGPVPFKRGAEALQFHLALFLLARFGLGFIALSVSYYRRGSFPVPKEKKFLSIRILTHFFACACFWLAIEEGTLALGHILNMTYPIFIAVFSFIFLRSQRDVLGIALSFSAFIGIALVIDPGGIGFSTSAAWGLGSGVLAAISLMALTVTRRENSTDEVLFYQMFCGLVLTVVFFYDSLVLPAAGLLPALCFFALAANGGQILLTIGFRYVTAVEGGVIGSSRILFAALFGPYLTSEPHLEALGWLGAALILFSSILLMNRRTAPTVFKPLYLRPIKRLSLVSLVQRLRA